MISESKENTCRKQVLSQFGSSVSRTSRNCHLRRTVRHLRMANGLKVRRLWTCREVVHREMVFQWTELTRSITRLHHVLRLERHRLDWHLHTALLIPTSRSLTLWWWPEALATIIFIRQIMVEWIVEKFWHWTTLYVQNDNYFNSTG